MAFIDIVGDVIMDFGDKATEVVMTIGDKTNTAIESGKLNARIHAEEKEFAKELQKIGAYYYNMYKKEMPVADEVKDFCKACDSHQKIIQMVTEELERVKGNPTK